MLLFINYYRIKIINCILFSIEEQKENFKMYTNRQQKHMPKPNKKENNFTYKQNQKKKRKNIFHSQNIIKK